MRRIRVTEEIKPGVFKGVIDETVRDRFVIDRLAFAETRGTNVIWEVTKPAEYDELVLAKGSFTALPIISESGN